MAWVILIIAAFFEVAFVITLKLSDGFRNKKYTTFTIISAALSFYLLSVALRELPVGTGYAVWTGIGAAGSILVGMFFFHEKRSALKFLFLSFIIAGVAGLKVFS
ncbi:DMT family transporter [Sporosarcina limicola]|uniref:Quaternary ammonium compound-resistance protein SugE n=1 Tax=Sporosarcina limicola TaxID=34101 RepID=A0A927R3J3_9BACL|nr:multidrug efflux SMR transporter [Sporosarcina limicola]MBE1555166.1 quaternary ammonium compound-resistance protein SugE [Sporosarcina limicola]